MASAAVAYPTRQPSPSRRKAHKPYQSATAATVPPPPDAFYGHEETAKMCGRFITALFACPDLPPSPSPQTSLASFVAYALHRTRLPACVTFCALFLLNRLKGRFPAARGSSGHRLFISAFMIASKVVCDDTYSNKSWTVVGQGMFTLKEINQMEREMCSYLEWILHVESKELAEFEQRVRRDYTAPTVPARPVTLTSSTITPPAPVPAPAASAAPIPVPIASPPKPVRQTSSEVRAAAAGNYPSPAGTPDLPAPPRPSASHPGVAHHPLQTVAHAAATSSSSLSSTGSTHVVSPPQEDSDIDSASSSPASSTCLSTPPQDDQEAAVPVAIAVAPAATAPHPHHKRSLEGIPVEIGHIASSGRKSSKHDQHPTKPSVRGQSSFGYAAPAVW